MHDLRQRHCPIITPTLLCWKWPRLAPLLWSHCQLECKITAQNKISRKVKLLPCDLIWRICTPFLAPVNSREKGEHPPYSRATYVPAGRSQSYATSNSSGWAISFLPGRPRD